MTPLPTPTETPTPTRTEKPTPTPTETPLPTPTETPTPTRTEKPTPTPTETPLPTPTDTPLPIPTATPTATQLPVLQPAAATGTSRPTPPLIPAKPAVTNLTLALAPTRPLSPPPAPANQRPVPILASMPLAAPTTLAVDDGQGTASDVVATADPSATPVAPRIALTLAGLALVGAAASVLLWRLKRAQIHHSERDP